MTVKAYTFDRAKNTAADVANYQDSQFLGKSSIIKGRGNDLSISTVGLNLTVDTGMAIIKGRFVEVSAPEVITLPANATGYITIRINLGLTNESSGTPGQANYVANIKQVKLGFQTSLFTDELLADKTTNTEGSYDFILAKVTTDASSITITTTAAVYASQSQVFVRDSATNVIVNAPKLRVDNSPGQATALKRSGSIEANSLANVSTDGALSIKDNSGDGISLRGTGSGAVTANMPYKTTGADASTGDNFVGNASSASKLKTPRSIIASGDVSGSTVFDGSDNVSLALSLPTVVQSNPPSISKRIGVNSNAWFISDIIVDNKGRVLGRQATSVTVEDQTVEVKADIAALKTYNTTNKTTVDEALAKKADTVTVDAALATKADTDTVDAALDTISNRVKTLEDNPTTGTGGDTVWGSITGDLQNQTDLKATLDTKADATTVNAELANKADNFTVDGDTLTMDSNRLLSAKPGKHYGVVTEPYDFDAVPDSAIQFLIVPDKSLLNNAPFNVFNATNITIQTTKYSDYNATHVIQTVTFTDAGDGIVITFSRNAISTVSSSILYGTWQVSENYNGVSRGLNLYTAFKPVDPADFRMMFESTNPQDDHYKETFELLQGSFIKSKKYESLVQTGILHYTEYEFVLNLKNTIESDTNVKSDDYQYKIAFNDPAEYFFADGNFFDSVEGVPVSPSYASVLYGNSTLTFHIESDKTLTLTSHGAIGQTLANGTMTVNFKIFV